MRTRYLPACQRETFSSDAVDPGEKTYDSAWQLCQLPNPVLKTCTSVRQRVAKDMISFAIDMGEENGYTLLASECVNGSRSLKI
jgi:hypothetical protein